MNTPMLVSSGSMPGRLVAAPVLLCAALLLQACASAERKPENPDPFEVINRQVFAFNEAADKAVIAPVAKGYNTVLPKPVRTGVSNFFANLTYPVTIVNGFLQGKFDQGVRDSVRMLVNTTFGVFGLFDPATASGLTRNREDFGLTFAHWGIAPGPYVVLPLLGPSTVRGSVGILANIQINPAVQWSDSSQRTKLLVVWFVETRAGLMGLEDTYRNAFDPYLFLRDAHFQYLNFRLRDKDVDFDDFAFPDDDLDDDF